MVPRCHIDIESFSEVNLKKVGLYRYAEDSSTELMVLSYAFTDGPVHTWIPHEKLPRRIVRTLGKKMDEDGVVYIQLDMPQDLREWMESGAQCRAHNSQFERVMLNGAPGRKLDIPKTSIDQWVCTAAKAAAHSLPRHLEGAAKALGTHGKDKVGKQDMLALSKPRTGKIHRYTPENDPDRFIAMYAYCNDDVRAERGIDEALPDLRPYEQRVFELDQKINDRGVCVDIQAVADVQVLIAEYKEFLEKKCREWTDGINPTQTEKLSNWIRDNGYDIENLQAATIREAVKDPECPALIRRVLKLRSIHSMKAVSKYSAIERAIASDGRLHGMFMYHGASTGRWSSLIVQLQNLFRPVIDDPDVAIDAFVERNLEWIKTLYEENPMKVFASCVRGVLISDMFYDLIAMDFSAIEARVLAWLAGQEDILEVFRGHGKIYEHAAAGIYRVDIEDVTKDQRFIGKIAVLALGYQGGKKAFAKMAKQYGVDIEEERAEEIKKDWRAANPKVVQLWRQIEESAVAAVDNPGRTYALSKKNKKIMFRVEGDFLYMRLPSGRRLAYFKPKINGDGQLTYLGIDTYTRQWCRVKTYGGKLTENAVQAIARDLLVHGMFNAEKLGYPIIGTVHDEVITEVPEDFGSRGQLAAALCDLPDWAEGLPVNAEGFRAKRYRK